MIERLSEITKLEYCLNNKDIDNNKFIRRCFKFLEDFGLLDEIKPKLEKFYFGKIPVIKSTNDVTKGKDRYYSDFIVTFSDNSEYNVACDWTAERQKKIFNDILELIELDNNVKEELKEKLETNEEIMRNKDNKAKLDVKKMKMGSNKKIRDIKGGCNLIIYGAPGTGKSYYVENTMRIDNESITRVIFHPEYSYFDFIGQYRPKPVYKNKDGKFLVNYVSEYDELLEPFIDYKFVPGPFTNVLVNAWNNKDKVYTLLIEELNRADAAAVFGDVFQLLDRNENGESEYGIEPSVEWGEYLKNKVQSYDGKVKIPSNMNIIATMNSADQGVFMLDTAFKRRWDYHFIPIKYDDDDLNIKVKYLDKDEYTWNQIVKAINERLINDGPNISEDRLIGPYFVKPDKIKSNTEESIKKILFYLWEDVLRNNGRKEIFGDGIKTLNKLFKEYKKGCDVLQIKDKLITEITNNGVTAKEDENGG